MVYAVCSTFAYVVNLLLASRFLHVSERTAIILSNTALVVYSLACGVNWCVILAMYYCSSEFGRVLRYRFVLKMRVF